MVRKNVIKIANEKGIPSSSIMRQYSRMVMSLGNIKGARKARFHARNVSDLIKKSSALRRIKNYAAKRKAYKLGLTPEKKRGRR